jgi:hypothetical protein
VALFIPKLAIPARYNSTRRESRSEDESATQTVCNIPTDNAKEPYCGESSKHYGTDAAKKAAERKSLRAKGAKRFTLRVDML